MFDVGLTDRRADSPIVGYALIIGLIVVIAAAALIFAGGVLQGLEEPRADSQFKPEVQNTSSYDIIYTNGETFDQTNTEEIRIQGENNTIVVTPDEWEDSSLDVGDLLEEDVHTKISLGETVNIVWVNTEGDSKIVDTIVFPTEQQVGTNVGSDGSASAGNGTDVDIVIH